MVLSVQQLFLCRPILRAALASSHRESRGKSRPALPGGRRPMFVNNSGIPARPSSKIRRRNWWPNLNSPIPTNLNDGCWAMAEMSKFSSPNLWQQRASPSPAVQSTVESFYPIHIPPPLPLPQNRVLEFLHIPLSLQQLF